MAADNQQQDSSQYTQIYSLAVPAGIKRDGTVFQSNQYTDGVWCRFQRGEPKKMGGYKSIFNSLNGIYRGMISQPNNGVNYIFAGNYESLDVFNTSLSFATGSGPFPVNFLPGSVFANVDIYTTTQITVPGDATTTFGPGTEFIMQQTGTPTVYTVSTVATVTGPPQQTQINYTPTGPTGPIDQIWLNDTVFTPDPVGGPYRTCWQFDAQFNPQGGELNIFAHPGLNLQNIDNGVTTQVLVGPIIPDANNQWNFSGLCDSEGQNPTYTPISVDGGVCILYPFIFVYGVHGFLANNNVDLALNDYFQQSFYDWNGPLANQINVAASKIVKGMPTRGGTSSPSGLFWATDSLVRVSFNSQATTIYWTYDIVSNQISIMSSSSVVEMDGTYFWMGVDRFYMYNGQVAVLPNDMNVNYLFNNLNYTQRQKVWATKIPRYNEIWFFYPRGEATECTDAIIYNVKDKLWYDAGQAVGAQRSCGYTTEIFPTPIWADWNYNPLYSIPYTVIDNPASLPAPNANQIYVDGNVTPIFGPGDNLTFNTVDSFNNTYLITASENIYDTTVTPPGVTLITVSENFAVTPVAGDQVFLVQGGFTIWQQEFGVNELALDGERAVYSSITTCDISWLTGTPSQNSVQGINRRMHLRRVEPNFLQTGVMSMTILGRKFAGGQQEQNDGPFYFNQDTGKIDLRVEHRLVRLKFESNEIDGNYEMGRNLITAEFGDERP
jgi:hypothetical protein